MSPRRVWTVFRREVWHRRLPHGLIGVRYLCPKADLQVRQHRRLWWAGGDGWPRPLWLAVQVWQWLRWVGGGAWIACWRFDRWQRRQSSAADDWPAGSGLTLLRLALTWCIAPSDSYPFGLHRRPEAALDFVYDRELPAWHRLRSLPLGFTPASRRLLQDKVELTGFLNSQGIPMAPILRVSSQLSRQNPLSAGLNGDEPVFCKMRSGNQGRGAFAAWREGDGWRGRTFTGRPLPDTSAVEQAWRTLLKLDDALIQPRLGNHPALAPLGLPDEAITVRWIGEWRGTELICLSAVLEAPVHRAENSGRTLYTMLPVEPKTGRLLPWPGHLWLPAEARDRADRLYEAAQAHSLSVLPGWAELAGFTRQAHAAFPDIRAIAWDWVITPTGPVLLEGNTGWGAALPQSLSGGFLHDGTLDHGMSRGAPSR